MQNQRNRIETFRPILMIINFREREKIEPFATQMIEQNRNQKIMIRKDHNFQLR